jgi:glycosyltransferase involved in cell wall biosynthesis
MDGVKNPLLSIIMPIHQVATGLYFQKEWITGLDPKEVEIICVLDSCPDDISEAIARFLDRMQGKVRILETEAGNPGEARNLGLKNALGEWITFWDSDDEGMGTAVLESISEVSSETEVIIGDALLYDMQSKRSTQLGVDPSGMIYNPGLWRYIFRRSSLGGVVFPPLSSGEDQVFLARYRYLERNSQVVNRILYKYTQNSGNQLTNKSIKISDALSSAMLIFEATYRSTLWKSSYSVMSARLILTYLRRGSHSKIIKLIKVMEEIVKMRTPRMFLTLFKTAFKAPARSIR